MKLPVLLLFAVAPFYLFSQDNIICTNPVATAVLAGDYDPAAYASPLPLPNDPAAVGEQLQSAVSAAHLKTLIIELSSFHTRNTGSDTASSDGIGAARRWVYDQFLSYSAANNNRLVVSYLQFDQMVCAMGQHRNIMAVLPGWDTTRHGIVLVEGHIDSRCKDLCDINCLANGVEDNASGTALVMEAARVMAPYQFANTIVFLVTIGEEQGLVGAEAMADYMQANNLPLRAVMNNDVIGGIICGKTSSPPSCPGLDAIDSTSVRLFSAGSFNSRNKQLARFIKLQYKENVLPVATVPMNVRIMSPEDRTGRGGDHIPFREHGYAAMRFTSANEHGDASNSATYTDRQHTSDDVLGVDTNGDSEVDSFFVDFNYLARNTVINVDGIAIAAKNIPVPPDFTAARAGAVLTIQFNAPIETPQLRVALRTATTDWDTVFQLPAGQIVTVPCPPSGALFASAAGVDDWGNESLFTGEKIVSTTGTEAPGAAENNRNIRLLQNRPNPFDEATWISFWVNEVPVYEKATVLIADLQGVMIQSLPVTLQQGLNEVLYTHGYGVRGAFTYTLLVDGKAVDTRKMIFAN